MVAPRRKSRPCSPSAHLLVGKTEEPTPPAVITGAARYSVDQVLHIQTLISLSQNHWAAGIIIMIPISTDEETEAQTRQLALKSTS